MSDERSSWGPRHVSLVALVIAGAAIGGMYRWGKWHAEPMAARAKVSRFAATCAHGDAFAPIAGALTALAPGAAVASVLMQRSELQLQREEMALQRKELKDARERYEAQGAALSDANDLARVANELARANQLTDIAGKLTVRSTRRARSDMAEAEAKLARRPVPLERIVRAKEAGGDSTATEFDEDRRGGCSRRSGSHEWADHARGGASGAR